VMNQLITGSAGPAAACPPRSTWRLSKARNPCPS
jgi:hypothetical protein